MLTRTHLAAALALATTAAPLHSLLAGTAGAIVGAWLPDVDLHLLPRGLAANPFARSPLRHRGATHSFLFLATLGAITFACAPSVPPAGLLFFALGFGSHIALDACTLSPVFPFWPLSLPLHLPPLFHARGIRTGGGADLALGRAGAILAATGWLYRAQALLPTLHSIR